MSESEAIHDEAYYEKRLHSFKDKTDTEYRKAYRKLYYLRNAETIKAYQRAYYKHRRDGIPPKRIKKEPQAGFKIIKKDIVIHFE